MCVDWLTPMSMRTKHWFSLPWDREFSLPIAVWVIWIAVITFAAFVATPGMAAELAAAPASTPAPDISGTASEAALKKADALFKEKNWTEARDAYDRVRDAEKDWHSEAMKEAVEGAVACSCKLQLWDDAVSRAEAFIAHTAGSLEEAVGQRFLAGLFLAMPHDGIKQGGKFLRGQHGQGVYVSSWRKDRKEAIRRYELARERVSKLAAEEGDPAARQHLSAQWIGIDFDLAAALAQPENRVGYGFFGYGDWSWWWGSAAGEEDSAAMDEADYDEPRGWGGWGWGGGNQEPPTGIPVGKDGTPQFIATPGIYANTLGAGAKIRFLLDEIVRLDDSPKKEDAAKAVYRRAMITRSIYGPDLADRWNQARIRRDRFGRPLPQEPDQTGAGNPDRSGGPAKKIWELGDDEALTFLGGQLRVVALPAAESPAALLHRVETEYPESTFAPKAHYARAVYWQTRQQFPQALEEYKTFLARYPKSPFAKDARSNIERIQKPAVGLGTGGIHLPGSKPKLAFTYGNAEKIEFKAIHFDMVGFLQDRMEETTQAYWNYMNLAANPFQDKIWKKYLGKPAASWSEDVPLDPSHRGTEGATEAPLSEPGAYIVEARVPGGEEVSRVLILVSDIAIVQKNLADRGLIFVCDARTGQPLAGKAVRIYEHTSEYSEKKKRQVLSYGKVTLVTDRNGVIEYKRKFTRSGMDIAVVVAGAEDRMAFSFFQNWNERGGEQERSGENGRRYYVITDRPVYRPGSTVRFHASVRFLEKREFQPPQPGRDVTVTIYDAKGNRAQTLVLKTDEMGGIAGEFPLGEEPPLGVYRIEIDGRRPDARENAGGLFRVEEYRKPEFEVSVKPAATQVRLGDKFKARIEARYYFGAPVAKGKVTYKVFREAYTHLYFGPGEYDWLYGKGYGRAYYAYPWLPWWSHWGCYRFGLGYGYPWLPWRGGLYAPYPFGWSGYPGDPEGGHGAVNGTRKALRDLVAQGIADLKPDGTYEVEIDTARATAEQGSGDHRYTVEAEVRDASRRTVEGKGSVIATRQAFYAFLETDGGWYRPGSDAFVEVRTLTPDNVPVAASGEVVVARIRYEGADRSQVKEEEIKRWEAGTDAQGRLSFKVPIPGEGQYRITFKTRDSWKQEVQGNAVFWVSGPKFDGRVYRFNDLEIIADKRSYKVGETAHLLINTAESNSRILFSDSVTQEALLSYRFIDLPSLSTVVDLPIKADRVPNFFVEATLVRNGRVHTESRELFVPPERGLLNVTVETDKAVYKPGEKGTVRVKASDLAGKPVAGEITLTAFDDAVTAIQDEFGPSPRVFFYGQKRYHYPRSDSSQESQFGASGGFPRLETNFLRPPEGWYGSWISVGGIIASGASRFADESKLGRGMSGGFAISGAFEFMNPSAQPLFSAAPNARGSVFASLDGFINYGSPITAGNKSGGLEPLEPEPEIRTRFADTALWLPSLKLGQNGEATTEITFPQSLTTWRLHGYAMTAATQVGDATARATTTKNLIVRLQSPRFFVERDEVVLSANVNSYLKTGQTAKAELIVPAALFEPIASSGEAQAGPDGDGNLHLRGEAFVEANGEHRFDWPLKVLKPGMAEITVKALTAEESDAMRLAFPVLVHGIDKTVAQNGSYRVETQGERTLKLDLPREIDPEQTRLEVVLSPSLAGVMVDALPYLVGYPYGCVEQTMSRFYPTVLVKETLKTLGTDLEAVGKQRRQRNADGLRKRFNESPVFDSKEMNKMVRAGLERLYNFQRNDGGWGWWREDDSLPFQSAYVLQGLHAARKAGIDVNDGVYARGFQFLQNSIAKELAKPKGEQSIGDLQTQAYIAYILTLEHRIENDAQRKWLTHLYEKRGELNNYGRALLALAMHQEKHPAEAQMLLRNLLQFVERDDSNETAWVRTPQQHWWFWWNNDIETNAWALKALVAIDPKNDLAPRLVKWLVNNRSHGYYWRGTRDTAQVIAALADYMKATGESAPDYTLSVQLDGQPVKEVKVTKENLFTFDNRVLLYGLQIKPGPHEIKIAKTGKGALYYSSYLSYFTKEEDVKGAGNEIFVERQYFKLIPKTETVRLPDPGAANTAPAGQPDALDHTGGHTGLRDGNLRVPLKNGDEVRSGEQIEVVLKITAKNTYDYLAFEDRKPAGFEPVELRSGGRWAGGLCANLELRDTKVVFFIGLLEQGEHVLRYKMRAETPGKFHALPTSASAMYAPEIRAISDEMRLGVRE